nr:Chromate resistance protein ChrB [Calditerrivibrio nitroreducens]
MAKIFIWRELRKLCSINYQTLWVLPYSKEIIDKVQNLHKVIENYGEQALLVEGKVLNKQDEGKILNDFVNVRDKEYEEVIEKCEDFFKEISLRLKGRILYSQRLRRMKKNLKNLKHGLKK